jgi:type IV pilus assembly protein PilA
MVWSSACDKSLRPGGNAPQGLTPAKSRETKSTQMRKHKGFSLIELLIVVAIILIIAAIAIPNLLRARMAANDSAAAGSSRTINTGEVAYFDAYPSIGFPAALATLGGVSPCTAGPATGCLIDNYLATNGGGAGKSGYNFNATGSAGGGSLINNQYYVTAAPISSQFGTRSYCSVEDAVLRLQPAGTLTLVPSYGACQALLPMQ